jgi:hypothetical protein
LRRGWGGWGGRCRFRAEADRRTLSLVNRRVEVQLMDQKVWLPLVTLVAGWLLSELAQAVRRRSGRKEPLRQALADLLEVRHDLIGNQFIFSQLSKRFNVSAEALVQLRRIIPTSEQRDPTLKTRFAGALLELAKHDPIHAFRLRGKDVTGLAETILAPVPGATEDLVAFVEQMRRALYQEILPELDRTVLATAWRAGLFEWIAVRRLLRDGPISKEALEATERLILPLVDSVSALPQVASPAHAVTGNQSVATVSLSTPSTQCSKSS